MCFFVSCSSNLPHLNSTNFHLILSLPSSFYNTIMLHYINCRLQRSPSSTTHTAISPLDIPEILALIFSFLDDYSISKAVVFVCRRWYRLNHQRLLRSVHWQNIWSQRKRDLASMKLIGAARLHCTILKNSFTSENYEIGDNAVRHLLVQSQDEYERQAEQKRRLEALSTKSRQRTRTGTTLYSFSPLKELHLCVGSVFNSTPIDTYIPPITTLASLVITHLSFGTIMGVSLSKILQNCPALEFIDIDGSYRLQLTWAPLVVGKDRPLNLRSFMLDSVTITPESLENLMLFTPRLKVLKLAAMSKQYANYDWSRFLGLLRSLPISLDSIHISAQDQLSSSQVLKEILDISPAVSKWSIWAFDMSASLLSELELCTDRLTTLELFSRPTTSSCYDCGKERLVNAPSILHHFLSTSDSLVHLRTLKTIASVGDMDIHNRGVSNEIYRPLPLLPVWRCRGLQTLELEIHGHGESRLEHPIHSRILFGYISRAFPLLEDLRIRAPMTCFSRKWGYSPWICRELEGGLCLLGRLKHLQRLQIVPGNNFERNREIKYQELSWILPSGCSYKYRRMRLKIIGSRWWQEVRANEDSLETRRSAQRQQQQLQDQESGGDVPVAAELPGQFQHLGLLKDVENMIKEMDSGSAHPLPSLERLTFVPHLFYRPEDAIDRIIASELSIIDNVRSFFKR